MVPSDLCYGGVGVGVVMLGKVCGQGVSQEEENVEGAK